MNRYVMNRFTLSELIIIITATIIMGILTLSVPLRGQDGNRGKSMVITCKSNLKKLAEMISAYAADANDCLPAGNTPWGERYLRWNYALSSYFPDSKKLPACPAVRQTMNSYGANYCYNQKRNARIPFYYFDIQRPGLSKLAKYSKQLPEIILFADAENVTMLSPRQKGCIPRRDISGNGIYDSSLKSDFNGYAPRRHENSMNYVSCGGSVHNISFDFWEDQLNHSGIIYNEQFNY